MDKFPKPARGNTDLPVPAPRFALSREGGLFLFFLIVLGSAAVYSGKFGLMILFCCLVAAVIVFTYWARVNCRQKLEINRRFVEEIYANKDTRIDVLVTNHGDVPVYGIHVFELFEENRTIGPMFFRKIAPGQTATARYLCQFPIRGNAHFCGVEIRSRFPLPFFEWRQILKCEASAFVFPQPIPGKDEITLTRMSGKTASKQIRKTDQTIREIKDGRRTGRILWKLSAKRQTWIEAVPTASHTQMNRCMIKIISKATLGMQRYERQISQITSFVLHQMQYNVPGDILVGEQIYHYDTTPTQRNEVLEMLAMV